MKIDLIVELFLLLLIIIIVIITKKFNCCETGIFILLQIQNDTLNNF